MTPPLPSPPIPDGRWSSRLPDLGPHGEGWVLIQFILLGLLALAGSLGPAWAGAAGAVSTLAGAALLGCGFVLALRGLIDLRENLTPFPRPKDGTRVVSRGSYRLVRHPVYGGIILGSLGWGLVTASPAALVMTAVLAAFFDLKSRREERWLVEHVAGYVAYREGRRKFIPWVY
jgi:protein-S-isoprenylcysteine O-methyltransferase Ste14